jgi:hypothetical protein
LAAAAVLLLLALPLSGVQAGEQPGEQEETEKVMVDVGTIIRKSSDSVHIWDADYEVNPMTEILTHDGEWLSLDDMVVPCRARVTYYTPRNSRPVITNIRLLGAQKPR